jgi:hypothetical protein
MTRPRSLLLTLPAALALVAPAGAGASCAPQSLAALVREVPIVVTAKAQPGTVASNGIGLLSPATFHIVAYDKGAGPADVQVQTALTEGTNGLAAASDAINPLPGQTWRLWGAIGADGTFQTSACRGSRLLGADQAPTAVTAARSTTFAASSFAGVARSGSLPTATVPRASKATIQIPMREANLPVTAARARTLVAVQIRRGAATSTITPRWTARDGQLTAKVAGPAQGAETVVVVTQAGSYALRLQAG